MQKQFVFRAAKSWLGTVSKKKKLMEFSIKGPAPTRQHASWKKGKEKHGLKML